MAGTLPSALLQTLLSAEDATARDHAWSEFVNGASKLLLRTAHSMGGGYDAAMGRYTYILEQLRRDDFRKLRGFAPNGCGKLSTWLVVVARRLCLDYERQRYGRLRSDGTQQQEAHARRRQLADLAAQEVDVEGVAVDPAENALSRVCNAELQGSVEKALALFTPEDQLLIKLRYSDGLSAAAIARLMNFPTPFHVYRKSAQLLKALRHALAQEGFDNSMNSSRANERKSSGHAAIPRLRSVP
jgi:RNA polymerase sigma factor (sigma-70 family)